MGTSTAWMIGVMVPLAACVLATLVQSVRHRSAGLTFHHELHRAWYGAHPAAQARHLAVHALPVRAHVPHLHLHHGPPAHRRAA